VIPIPNNALHSWNEPWFFTLHTSTKLGWIVRGCFFVAVYALFFAVLFLEQGNPNSPPFGTAEIIFLPALVAGVFSALLELPNLQRMVAITDKDISCIGSFAMFGGPIQLIMGMGNWNRKEIKHIQLLRPGEEGNRFLFGLMIITPKYSKPQPIAVPSKVSLDAVATSLHSIDIPVQLSGWVAAGQSNSNQEETTAG